MPHLCSPGRVSRARCELEPVARELTDKLCTHWQKDNRATRNLELCDVHNVSARGSGGGARVNNHYVYVAVPPLALSSVTRSRVLA